MESAEAVSVLAALGQATRLDTFRLLVRLSSDGMAASEIAEALSVPRNTMSSHLAILARAQLVTSQRFGTKIIYRADLSCLKRLTAFLLEGCCGDQPELCAPMFSDILGAKPTCG